MNRRAIQIVDLGFGDSGKGTMVDYLARRHEADLVVRFNGGPQAGHNVVLPDGRHHTFAQFGSGSFIPGLRTLLSRFMLIEPYAMLNEAAHLASIGVTDVLARTIIDERCLVITPPQQIANRIRERARLEQAHGTCGMGIGECVADSLERPEISLRAGDLHDPASIWRKLTFQLALKREMLAPLRSFAIPDEARVLDGSAWIDTAIDVYASIADRTSIVPAETANAVLREANCPIFEGAQGVLLDERFGFHPHTTWSKATFSNADKLLEESNSTCTTERIGVIRTYMTRHGAGPFASFDREVQKALPEPHNHNDGWQGEFRKGPLDLVLLRYAIEACGGIDGLAITHLDRLPNLPPVACDGYLIEGKRIDRLPLGQSLAELEDIGRRLQSAERLHWEFPAHDEESFIEALTSKLKTRVLYRSRGPTWLDKT